VELLEAMGLTSRKRMRLIIGEEGRGESQREGDSEAVGSQKHRERAQRKRRRISSAATVASDEESRECSGRGLIDEHRIYDGWVTVESERSCGHCAGVGVLCKSFVLRSRGAPRFACCRCHDLKKMCEFTKPRRLAHIPRIRGRKGTDGEDDTDGRGLRIQRDPGRQPESRPPNHVVQSRRGMRIEAEAGQTERLAEGTAKPKKANGSGKPIGRERERERKGRGRNRNPDGIGRQSSWSGILRKVKQSGRH
jgi:hypothetical protein